MPVIHSLLKADVDKEQAGICLFVANKFLSRPEFKIGATEIILFTELVNSPIIAKNETLSTLFIALSKTLYKNKLAEIPTTQDSCLKLLTKYLEFSNTTSYILMNNIAEYISTLMYTHSIKSDDNEVLSTKDTSKLNFNSSNEHLCTNALEMFNYSFKRIWKTSDEVNNPKIRYTICLAYSIFIKSLSSEIILKHHYYLIKKFMEILEAKHLSENDQNFFYVCHLGTRFINVSFFKDRPIHIIKSFLDTIIKKILVPWTNVEKKSSFSNSPVAKICIFRVISTVFPILELSDMLEDLELSNTIIELISSSPFHLLNHVLLCANSICMHSTKSSVKMLHTLAVMVEQEFIRLSSPNNFCENLKKYSQAVSVIFNTMRNRNEHLSKKVIKSLVDISMSLISKDYSKTTGLKAVNLVSSGLLIMIGFISSRKRTFEEFNIKELVVCIEILSTVYACEDLLEDPVIKYVLEIRILSLDVLYYLFKNCSILKPEVIKPAIAALERTVDLASHTLDNYKQLLSNHSCLKPEIVLLFDRFLKKLLELTLSVRSLITEWDYKLMYLCCRLICILKLSDNYLKRRFNASKCDWIPHCNSLYLRIIDEYTHLSLKRIIGNFSNTNPRHGNFCSEYGPIFDFTRDFFSIKHWFYDTSSLESSRLSIHNEEIIDLNIHSGTTTHWCVPGPLPPDSTLVMDLAIKILATTFSNKDKFIADILCKLEKSFYLEAKSERLEKAINCNRFNILVCLYYMIENARINSIEILDVHINKILNIVFNALEKSNEIIYLVSCSILKSFFSRKNAYNLLLTTFDKVVEESDPKLVSLALVKMYEGVRLKGYEDTDYTHKVTGYVVHKLNTCKDVDIKWHLHAIKCIMEISFERMMPYIYDVVSRIRNYIFRNSELWVDIVSATNNSLSSLCLLPSVSIGSIIKRIILHCKSMKTIDNELHLMITDVYMCMIMEDSPLSAIGAIQCEKLFLDNPSFIPINLSTEIQYLLTMLCEERGVHAHVVRTTVVNSLFEIMQISKDLQYTSLTTLYLLTKLLKATDLSMDFDVFYKLYKITIRVIELDKNEAPKILVQLCKILLLNKNKGINDLDSPFLMQQYPPTISSSPLMSSNVPENNTKYSAKLRNRRKYSSTNISLADALFTDCPSLFIRYLPDKGFTMHKQQSSPIILAYAVNYLRRSLEYSIGKIEDEPHYTNILYYKTFSCVKNALYVDLVEDLVKIACYGINSEYKYICTESYKLLYTVFKYFSNTIYAGFYVNALILEGYQAQISAVVRRTLSLDVNLELTLIAFKILFMQIMNCMQDVSLISSDVNALVLESIKRFDELGETGFCSEHHLLIKSTLTLIWCHLLNSIPFCDLVEMIKWEHLKKVYVTCLSHFGVHADILIGHTTFEKVFYRIVDDECNTEFHKFFSDLTVRIDTNRDIFKMLIDSLLLNSDDFIISVLFDPDDELQQSNTTKISAFLSGIINVCFTSVDFTYKCRVQNDSNNRNGSTGVKLADAIAKNDNFTHGRTEEEYLITTVNFLVRLFLLKKFSDEIYSDMKNVISSRLMLICENRYRISGISSADSVISCITKLTMIMFSSGSCRRKQFERCFIPVSTIVNEAIHESNTRNGNLGTQYSEKILSIMTEAGKFYNVLFLSNIDMEVKVNLILPNAFCMISGIYSKSQHRLSSIFSESLSEVGNMFSEIISEGLGHITSYNRHNYGLKELTTSVINMLIISAQLSSVDINGPKNALSRINLLNTSITLLTALPDSFTTNDVLMGLKKLSLEYLDQGNPYEEAVISCVEKLYLLASDRTGEQTCLTAKKCISAMLPFTLSLLLSSNYDEIKTRIAKLVINIQACINIKDKKEIYVECIVNLFSRVLLRTGNEISESLRTIIGNYLIHTASIDSNFKTIISSMCHHRKSALKACMTEVSTNILNR